MVSFKVRSKDLPPLDAVADSGSFHIFRISSLENIRLDFQLRSISNEQFYVLLKVLATVEDVLYILENGSAFVAVHAY